MTAEIKKPANTKALPQEFEIFEETPSLPDLEINANNYDIDHFVLKDLSEEDQMKRALQMSLANFSPKYLDGIYDSKPLDDSIQTERKYSFFFSSFFFLILVNIHTEF